MDIQLPLRQVVFGTPVSHQSARSDHREAWKATIREEFRRLLPSPHFASTEPVAVTIYMFLEFAGGADIDNAAKPILDALSHLVVVDDSQVKRLVVQKFEPGTVFEFIDPDDALATAIAYEKDSVYIRVSADLYEPLYR